MIVNEYRPHKNQSAPDRDVSKPKFPAARYFQVHFEYLESQLDGTQRCLEALKQQIAELEARLDATHAEFDLSETEK